MARSLIANGLHQHDRYGWSCETSGILWLDIELNMFNVKLLFKSSDMNFPCPRKHRVYFYAVVFVYVSKSDISVRDWFQYWCCSLPAVISCGSYCSGLQHLHSLKSPIFPRALLCLYWQLVNIKVLERSLELGHHNMIIDSYCRQDHR